MHNKLCRGQIVVQYFPERNEKVPTTGEGKDNQPILMSKLHTRKYQVVKMIKLSVWLQRLIPNGAPTPVYDSYRTHRSQSQFTKMSASSPNQCMFFAFVPSSKHKHRLLFS